MFPQACLYRLWRIQHGIAGSVADSPGGKPGDPNLVHTHTFLAHAHSNFVSPYCWFSHAEFKVILKRKYMIALSIM